MRSKVVFAVVAALIVLMSGAALTLTDGVYRYDITYSEQDSEVSIGFESNTGAVAKAVMFSNSGRFAVDHVYALYDERYASVNSEFLQKEMLEDMHLHFSLLSDMSFEVVDADAMFSLIDSADPRTTAFMLVSGSLPDILYEGVAGSPILSWMDRGGVLVNVSGCLGKYVSHGPEKSDIEQVTGYAKLFGQTDDICFLDFESRRYTDYDCNAVVRDSLNMYMNEYTYGIATGGFEEVLNLGYMTIDGLASAAAYRSGNGMVLNFGSSIVNHVHFDYNIVKVLAAGIDYTSKVIGTFEGEAGDTAVFFKPEGSFSVYAYMGSPRAVHGEGFRA